jgi:limonene-1,2-epoxide hydrolase
VGLATTTGIDEAIALVEQLERTMAIDSVRIEMLAIAADGNKVLTERLDYMVDAAGNILTEDPVMGIFEVDGEHILAWRDYFDSASALARVRPA